MCERKETYTTDKHFLDRQERQKMLEELDIRHSMFLNALDNFKGKGDNNIPFAELKKFPLMKWVNLNDKVKFRKRNPLESYLMFDTVMTKGGEFGMHYHSDCVEYVEVISGKLVDIQTNHEYNEGEIAIYNAKEKHIPVAMEDTVLRVFFKQI